MIFAGKHPGSPGEQRGLYRHCRQCSQYLSITRCALTRRLIPGKGSEKTPARMSNEAFASAGRKEEVPEISALNKMPGFVV